MGSGPHPSLPLVCSYPELKPVQSINAHPSNCICIKFDPTGKFFATGSADALVSLWDVEELVCVRCFSRCVCVCFTNTGVVAVGTFFTFGTIVRQHDSCQTAHEQTNESIPD